MSNDNLSAEKIKGLIQQYDTALAKNIEHPPLDNFVRVAEKMVTDLAQRIEQFTGEAVPAFENVPPDSRDADYAFLEAYRQFYEKTGYLTKIDMRVLASDISTLHWLFSYGALEKAYQQYLLENKYEQALSEGEKIEIKAQLARTILDHQRMRSGERELLTTHPDIPTVGFEYEVSNPIAYLMYARRMIANVLEDFENHTPENFDVIFAKLPDASVTGLKSIIAELGITDPTILIEKLKEVGALIDALVVWQTADNSPESSPIRKKLLYEYTARINGGRESQIWGEFTNFTDVLRLLRRLAPPKMEYLEKLGTHKASMEEVNGPSEVKTQPSFSLHMQLRDTLYLLKCHALTPKVAIHQTVEGVKLTPKDNDYMEMSALLTVAGYQTAQRPDLTTDIALLAEEQGWDLSMSESEIRNEIFSYLRGKQNVHAVIKDILDQFLKKNNIAKYPKPIDTYLGYAYFPGFKFRERGWNDHMQSYPEGIADYYLEIRAFPEFNLSEKFDFAHWVRCSYFYWLTAWGAKSTRDTEEVISYQKELGERYQQLQRDWSIVLAKRGIYQPKSNERFSIYHLSAVKTPQPKFETYINGLIIWRDEEERAKAQGESVGVTLQDEARRLIREYQTDVKKITGLK